jgi:single-strand DNA-binding protein
MIHDAQVNLAGYVATDPKFRKVAGDTSSTKLRVAYTARRRDRETGEWGDGPTSFVNIQCWRTLADNVHMSVHKGEPVLIMGRLQVRRYEDTDGALRTAVEIEATAVGHDLARGVAQFSRTRWPAAGREAPVGTPEPGDGAESTSGPEAGARPAPGDAAPDEDGVVDERAVAEFARELTESLGTAGLAGPETDAGAQASNGTAADDAGAQAGGGAGAQAEVAVPA